MTEEQLEQLCLEWFAETGWVLAHGPDLAPDGTTPERWTVYVFYDKDGYAKYD